MGSSCNKPNMFENFVNGLGLREGLVLGSVAGSAVFLAWIHSHQSCFSSRTSCPTMFVCPARFFKNAVELEEKAVEKTKQVVDNTKENLEALVDKANECFEEVVGKTQKVEQNSKEAADELTKAGKKTTTKKKSRGKKKIENKKTKEPPEDEDNGANENELIIEDLFKNETLEKTSLAAFYESAEELGRIIQENDSFDGRVENSDNEVIDKEGAETNESFDAAKKIKEEEKSKVKKIRDVKKTKVVTKTTKLKKISKDATDQTEEVFFKDEKHDYSNQAKYPESAEDKSVVETADESKLVDNSDDKHEGEIVDEEVEKLKQKEKLTKKRKIKESGKTKKKEASKQPV